MIGTQQRKKTRRSSWLWLGIPLVLLCLFGAAFIQGILSVKAHDDSETPTRSSNAPPAHLVQPTVSPSPKRTVRLVRLLGNVERNIRSRPTTENNQPIRVIQHGAIVETLALVKGQDPYHDGRDYWLELVDGSFMWAAGTDAGSVYGMNVDFRYMLPLDHYYVTVQFGAWVHGSSHTGVDMAALPGTPVRAAASGSLDVGYGNGWGEYVKLQLPNGDVLIYAHLARKEDGLRSGMLVNTGQVLGFVGSHGAGPSVHLEYHPGGREFADPSRWFGSVGLEFPRYRP